MFIYILVIFLYKTYPPLEWVEQNILLVQFNISICLCRQRTEEVLNTKNGINKKSNFKCQSTLKFHKIQYIITQGV